MRCGSARMFRAETVRKLRNPETRAWTLAALVRHAEMVASLIEAPVAALASR